jgi:hypothetical protein
MDRVVVHHDDVSSQSAKYTLHFGEVISQARGNSDEWNAFYLGTCKKTVLYNTRHHMGFVQ